MYRALAFLALVSSALAQSNDTGTGILAIEAYFKQSLLVPDLLSSFTPSALLDFNYGAGNVAPGTLIDVDQLNPTPTLTVTFAGSAPAGLKYTLALVDPGAVGAATTNVTRHWLANGVTVGDDGKTLNVPGAGQAITDYGRPFPDSGSGAHRYAFLLWAQPDTFTPPADLSTPDTPIDKFNVIQYAKNSGLGDIVAGNYFTVEQGTATFSQPATSAVNTATLSVGGGGAGSASGSGTGSATSKPSGSSTGSAAPTKTGSASRFASAEYGVVAMAVLVGVVVA